MDSSVCACEVNRQLYVPEPATVEAVSHQTASETLLRLRLHEDRPLGHCPGQFVEVSVPGVGEAPISIASAPCEAPWFELCVRKTGNVTAALTSMNEGDLAWVRGPFGNGFPDEELHGKDVLVVAGGIGLVPVRPLIHHIICNRDDYAGFTILYGMKRPEDMLFVDEIADWMDDERIDLRVAIDRPHPDWDGHVGVITTLFPRLELTPANTRAVIVGPPIMYKFVLTECRLKGIADEHMIVSLERHMKCGVGKCGHCQINGKYVCTEGPVFTYHEIKGLWEAI